jgi:hypothetical protein
MRPAGKGAAHHTGRLTHSGRAGFGKHSDGETLAGVQMTFDPGRSVDRVNAIFGKLSEIISLAGDRLTI